MADLLEQLTALRDMGAVRVSFFEDGALHSIEFVPPIVTYAGDTDPAPAPGPTTPAPPGGVEFVTPKAFRELMKGGGL